MKKLSDGFAVERWRKQLLSQGKYSQLRTTYSENYPDIPGSNTPDFWDHKFTGDNTTLFAMAYYRNKWIAESLSAGKKVLNLGAGKGYLEQMVHDRFGNSINWVGTDFTQTTLQALQKTFPVYKFIKTGLLQLPFKNQVFDTVCLLEVLEHISPAQTFTVLGELTRVLKKGGNAIISVPLNEGLEEMMPENPNAHLRVYSIELLRFELAQVGLEVIQVQTLSAFGKLFVLKHFVNSVFKVREPNNVIIWARKK